MLQKEIDTLAKKHGGKSVPVHLTLMGGIVDDLKSAEERAQLLSSQLKVCFSSSPSLFRALIKWSVYRARPREHEERTQLLSGQPKVRLNSASVMCEVVYFLIFPSWTTLRAPESARNCCPASSRFVTFDHLINLSLHHWSRPCFLGGFTFLRFHLCWDVIWNFVWDFSLQI